MPLSRSALYYRTHPEAAKKHREYNIKRNKSKKQTAYRVELNKERRSRGIYGKGGPDMSHTESGKLVEEDPSKNRGRNGAKGESTKRRDFVESRGKKCGKSYIPATDKCTKGSGVRTAAKLALGAGLVLGTLALARRRVNKAKPYIKRTPVITGSSPKALLPPTEATWLLNTEPSATRKVHKIKPNPEVLKQKLDTELNAWLSTEYRNANPEELILRKHYNTKHKYIMVDTLTVQHGVALSRVGTVEMSIYEFPTGAAKPGVKEKEVFFTTNRGYDGEGKYTAKDSLEVFSKVERMIQKAIENDSDDTIISTKPLSEELGRIYKKYGFIDNNDYYRNTRLMNVTVGELKKRSRRNDALRPRKGKKCGESFIPRTHKCNLTAGSITRTTQKAAILGAGVALGAFAAVRARSLWTPALSRLYTEARKANQPWNTYAKKLKEDLVDPTVLKFSKARTDLKKRICSRGDSRQDAWSACKYAVGEASSYGRVLKHPVQPLVFKVPKENYYVPVSNGRQMTGSKQLNKKVAKMFDQEAENLQLANRLKVDSPRLEGYNPNTKTIAMEFLDGFDTYRSIRRKFPNIDRAVEFQLFANLRKMHTNGLVHMDLHPGNVLVNPATKRISIIDFGTSERSSNLTPFDFLDMVHTEVTTVTRLTLPLTKKHKDLIIASRDKYLPVIQGAKNYYTTVPDDQIPSNIEQFYQEVGVILLNR